ncbi:Phenylalanine-tRNA ligase alpha subunit [Purpureocillium lavendulum]|uniref:Chromatin modification-related protein EAF6 n=1 Tax=Purpureocillium lavendulum TaxID=1247861 RepID=A0AB34G2A9_9HYPO|nr:Phenylalanine-tRNA ligase alpha subunit [Purpureocillium lavendulum]
MASKVDARLLKSTKFPPEFSEKVDMKKVNEQVMKKWIEKRISEILKGEDDVLSDLCFNLLKARQFPDIKSIQIQLTGFLDKDTAPFCKELWNMLLSAQSSSQGVPKELLEAKKLELMQKTTRDEAEATMSAIPETVDPAAIAGKLPRDAATVPFRAVAEADSAVVVSDRHLPDHVAVAHETPGSGMTAVERVAESEAIALIQMMDTPHVVRADMMEGLGAEIAGPQEGDADTAGGVTVLQNLHPQVRVLSHSKLGFDINRDSARSTTPRAPACRPDTPTSGSGDLRTPPRGTALMADNKGGAGGNAPATTAEYKKAQARVRELVERRRAQERKLAAVEDSIASKEAAYLDSTPAGNIITGFDNYMKGQSGAAAQRRKAGPMEQNRVFSRSSISYRPNNGDSTPGSTPASHAPTPVSASFRDSGSAHPTPSSGTGKNSKSKKKEKEKEKETEESEGDSQMGKKRTNFGASRK